MKNGKKMANYENHSTLKLLTAKQYLSDHCKEIHNEECSKCHHFYGNKIASVCDLGLLTVFNDDKGEN